MMWFWLSFADAKLPKGTQFLGVAIVEAIDGVNAIQVAHMKKCNPGGEVSIQTVPPNQPAEVYEVLKRWRDKLIDREQTSVIELELASAGAR